MHITSRFLLVAFVSCTLTSLVIAGPPTIGELRPWGAQRGQTVTLMVAGDQLAAGAELFSAIPGKIEEQPGGNAGQLTFKLEVRPDAPVGVYPIRLRTPTGLSNVLLFSVGDLPEATETEPNDSLPAMNQAAASNTATAATVPLIPLPATVNGSASGTDQDVIRFAGKKGERIVLEVEAQRIGSMLDPAIYLYSPSGRELALADETPGLGLDCRLDVTLPEDGEYSAVVHDSKYAGGNPGFYRLKLGAFAYAETAFPLGWQREREVEVTLLGGTLVKPLKTKITANAAAGQNRMFLSPPVPGPQARLPFRFVLGDAPELIEPETDTISPGAPGFKDAAVMNGRIAKVGEVDRYKFPVTAGQTWIFEVEAANLGLSLDALLTVAGPQGNVLASADDGNGLDPRLQFAVPGGIDHVVLSIEDLHGRGGPMFAYRLKAQTLRTDFSLQVAPPGPPLAPGAPQPLGSPAVNIPRGGTAVVQVNVARSGYNGPIQLTIPESANGITAEDGLIPAGAATGFLVLSAAPDAPLRAFDLEINGQGGAATKPMVRPAATSCRSAYAMSDAFVARVPAAVCEAPPAALAPAERSIRLVHGHNRQIKITAQRTPAATEAINVNGTGLPGGVVSGTTGVIAKEANELVLTLVCSPENPIVGPLTMQLSATTQAGGRQETIELPPVRVEIARPFALELLNQNVTIAAGSKVRIAGIVRREAPFEGLVKVGPVGGIPQYVSLTAVDVPKGESLALLELVVGAAATPVELDLQIRASTDMEGRKRDKDYVIPDTSLKVKIVPKPTQ